MAYTVYLQGVPLPVTPEKIRMKIKNRNETMELASGIEVNVLKAPGLTEIEFDAMIPQVRYPFAHYPDRFRRASYYLELFENLKLEQIPFPIVISRSMPGGSKLFSTRGTDAESEGFMVSLEEYTITEDQKEGFDLMINLKLKQHVSYQAQVVEITESTEGGSVISVESQRESLKQTAKQYTVVKGDTLWNICKKELGDGSLHQEIAKLNGIRDANKINPGQVIRLE